MYLLVRSVRINAYGPLITFLTRGVFCIQLIPVMLLTMVTQFYPGRIMRNVFFIVALLAGVALISGCTDYQAPGQTQTPGKIETTEVMMQNYLFVPQDIRIATGDTVTWTNDDRVTHTVVGDNGEFDSGELAPGETFNHTFEEAGVVSYSCTIHPGMIGSVTVE